MADLDRRRHLSDLVAHETRALLRPERTNHGRGLYGGGRRVPRREAAALPNARYSAMRPGRMFDLHPDGERFALAPAAQAEEGAKRDKVVVILNFFDELRRISPTK